MNYLHVGTHKSGTSFMQQNVFPKFRGIEYINPWQQIDCLLRMREGKNYLLSNERFGGRLWSDFSEVDASLRRLKLIFPNSRILYSFRRHDEFILSSYQQYVHEGSTISFEEYFDIDNDAGVMKKKHFCYRPRIESAIRHFGSIPFVFLLDEIKDDLGSLLQDIAKFVGAEAPSINDIDLNVRNKSVNFYQSQILRWLNKHRKSKLNPKGRFKMDNELTAALRIDPRRFCQYWLFFLPDTRKFLSDEIKGMINESYSEDWEYVKTIAAARKTAS